MKSLATSKCGSNIPFFEGSYAFIDKQAAKFASERCIINKYVPKKQSWKVTLLAGQFKDSQVLVPASDLVFDCFTAAPDTLPPLPEKLMVAAVGASGDGLFANSDVAKGVIILKEEPLTIIGGRMDNYSSCWTSYLSAITKHGTNSAFAVAFEELTDGGIVYKHIVPARILFNNAMSQVAESTKLRLQSDEGKKDANKQVRKVAEVLARWQANAHTFKPNPDGESFSALYRYISKANHSCEPNCIYATDEQSGIMQLVAQRNICAGEELTASYFQEDPSFQGLGLRSRRERCLTKGFQCLCTRCVREVEEEEKGCHENEDQSRSPEGVQIDAKVIADESSSTATAMSVAMSRSCPFT
eukprot:TRINITY_DN57261_c0_g1_i1.p1 TRINITY_DN57261_c0_g1~~TRINITY_DN57261_c0_g1_i1.p1  ORF type:complete len:357 (+),score=70.07 TRINITY_DN57261_c0_g1_i1:50-1120(+)